jgi:hypothetical protein
MGKAAKTGRKRPGLTRRMIRSTLRVGMLATAVLVHPQDRPAHGPAGAQRHGHPLPLQGPGPVLVGPPRRPCGGGRGLFVPDDPAF